MKKCITILASLLALQMQAQRTLFDNGWKFTHEGKTISVDLPQMDGSLPTRVRPSV